jgi:hypothetical protein
MRSGRVIRASDSECRSRNCPRFDPSILRHSGIFGAADEAVLNIVHKKERHAFSWACGRGCSARSYFQIKFPASYMCVVHCVLNV